MSASAFHSHSRKLWSRAVCALWVAALLALAPTALVPSARAQDEPDPAEFERTPPRLSFTDGEVSFLRAGAEDWTPAQVNMPLANGDQLYTGSSANIELQVGTRAFVRAGEDTQLGITSVEPDFVQFRVLNGHASVDVRSLKVGSTIELDTPHGAFTIEHSGYYRIEVTDDTTTFTSRRGGNASVTPATGQTASIAPSEQIVINDGDNPKLETYAAPELDDWDRWNYTRTDQLLDAVSSRYVPNGVYGVDDLDHYGDWRVVPSYGSVWVPRVASGWAPYSTGSWVYDPFYGWTWVDEAPWGWAPFHYGRWVWVGNYWGWAPGPLVARAYYAPALVAFFDAPSISIGIGFGHAHFSWVALGWGEPCVPWWGPRHWRGSPRWVGWGGPRVVNNVVINKTTIINVNEVHGWANASRPGAVLGVERDRFGHGRVRAQAIDAKNFERFRPVRGDLDVKPASASLAPVSERGARPQGSHFDRQVVATREPRAPTRIEFERGSAPKQASEKLEQVPPTRVVKSDPSARRQAISNRPPFGSRSEAERQTPEQPPRFRARAREEATPQSAQPSAPSESRNRLERPTRNATPSPARQRAPSAPPETQTPTSPRAPERATRIPSPRERTAAPPRDLPGEPANRVFRAPPRESAPRSIPPGQQRIQQQPRPSAPPQPQSQPRSQPRQQPGGHSTRISPRSGGDKRQDNFR
jgi:hypothetical protein